MANESITILNNIKDALTVANNNGMFTDTIWISPYETLFEYIDNKINDINQKGNDMTTPTEKKVSVLLSEKESLMAELNTHVENFETALNNPGTTTYNLTVLKALQYLVSKS
jgi:hypothetical protein